MDLIQVLFLGVSFIALVCALMTVLSNNPIFSAIYLIGCFFSIAAHYLLLNAQFLAIVHIIVYAGAIMVLFLFTLMMINFNEDLEKHKPAIAKVSAALSGGFLFLLLVGIIVKAGNLPLSPQDAEDIGLVKSLGKVLLSEYLFPFEFISILFLTAMVGAVLLSKKESSLINRDLS